MIIGIVGNIGSGKDTVANYLITKYQFKQDSFAANVKVALSVIFGWDIKMLEGTTPESRAWREQVDEWWANRLGIPHLTPRWVMTYWGTDLARNMFHNDIWIASLEKRLNYDDNIVISDGRFINEIDSIRKHNGIIIKVMRGGDPEWASYAKDIFSDTAPKTVKNDAFAHLSQLNIHRSEWEQYGINYDYIIHNDGSLDQLYFEIDNIINQELNLPASTLSLPDVVSVDSWNKQF